ncbi:MAG: competence/damage-inducible protein A [Cyanobacteria bacterium P01_H01_bin.15]
MSAEIICVGTEILLGDIVNTNAQYLGQELANLGIPHYYQTVVGDNPTRLKQVIEIALHRASILLFTGGLGPTPDDLTIETIADYFQTPLTEHPELLKDIKQKFASRGLIMTPSNRKQALLPIRAEILPNSRGTAPGIIWQPQPDCLIMTFPGVPSEMQTMWRNTAIPFLKSQGWGKEVIYSQTLRFRGTGESALAEKVQHLLNLSNPTVAPYASQGEVRLRISAKALSEDAALGIIEPVAQEIQTIAGLDYFGMNDDTLASVVGERLRDQAQTLSVAESCTGGGLGALLTGTPGSSFYFSGGIIAYANETKIKLLGVKPESLAQAGAVSEIVAAEMAQGVRTQLGTDWSLSITGVAGPGGGSPEKPVGTVCFGLAGPQQLLKSWTIQLGNRPRSQVRHRSAHIALDALRRSLL